MVGVGDDKSNEGDEAEGKEDKPVGRGGQKTQDGGTELLFHFRLISARDTR